MRGLVFSSVVVALSLVFVAGAGAACGSTTFQPVSPYISGVTHSAYFLSDPLSEQRAVFDLSWGGALASLKWQNREHVYGNATGAMVQPAFHALSPDYNPTLSGEQNNSGSPVTGVTCVDSNTLRIITTMLDFNHCANPNAPFNTVKNGVVVAGSCSTPYVVESTATFVSNPSGPPSYYLKLEYKITNTHPTETYPWGFEFAGYVPGSFSNWVRYPANCTAGGTCPSSSTPDLLAGLYPNLQYTSGVAFFAAPSRYWSGAAQGAWVTFGSGSGGYTGLLHSSHTWTAYWGLGPGVSKTLDWYVLVGDWQKAVNFALATP